jgi:hypothetical protein
VLEWHLGSIKEERDYGLGYGEKFRLQPVRDYHVMGRRVILTGWVLVGRASVVRMGAGVRSAASDAVA